MIALLLFWSAGILPAGPPASSRQDIPIASIRQLSLGTTVTVVGLVTVPSGRFRSSSDDNGFALHDQTAGIWISTPENLGFAESQRVEVTGTVVRRAGEIQIGATSAKRLPGRDLTIATGSVGPSTLGAIITVEGKITRTAADLPYGHKVWLDDGSGETQIFINTSTDIHATPLTAGKTIRVTGLGSQYETTYEVQPRSRRDVRILRLR